ncbi:hypothetical protein CLV31_11877 [Algoriphagus aquaeductus]|uniref:DUF2141 domain-containing protein n=1 Tax=Algoriphagus aquaeductus TaxID=475299 RepID=A0A326RP68_9BACT|nr:hypothetical protein [Algoriphagus aquaeductus]PZV78101.1 hypothetical protein CLV31_11877 [Algoriphagus aquaeductus]
MKRVTGILLIILSVFTSCGMRAEEKCTSITLGADRPIIDTLMIDSPDRNSIHHAELQLSGEVKDTLKLGIGSFFQVELLPGKYDTLIYKGDWYADPMVLNAEGGKGSDLSFCARFYNLP